MPLPVFTYFAGKALGESSRLLMAYGDFEFEDRRITKADWPTLKPNTPFGQIPTLELDGREYAQSEAISRYFGRKFRLNGDTPEDELEIDAIVGYVHDISSTASQVFYEEDEAIKAAKHEDLSKNVYPEMLQRLAKIIEENNGHLALGKLTWADFVFAGMFDYLQALMQNPDLGTQYPVFKKVVDAVLSIPNVKKFTDAPKLIEFPY